MGVQIIHRPPEHLTPVSMMRGNASWVAGLLSACFGMSALMGHPVDDRKQVKTAVPQLQLVSREERKTNPAPNQEAAFTVKVREGMKCLFMSGNVNVALWVRSRRGRMLEF